MRYLPLILALLSFAGCSTFYPKYQEPSDNKPPKTLMEADAKLEILRTTYREQVKNLREKSWQVGDAGIAGGVIATLGAVARSSEGLVGGAAVSGTTALVGSRYGLEKQSEAYWKATQSIVCAQDKFHVVNVPILAQQPYEDIDNPENFIVSEITRGIRGIQHKLFDRLMNQSVNQPDAAQFESALKNAIEKKPIAPKGARAKAVEDAFSAARIKAFETALARFGEDVTACLSAF